jgi:3'(2'), 5'-bisphosphate nucleotidase
VTTTLDDARLAADLAVRAGAVLNGVRAAVGDADFDGKALKDRGDAVSHAFLMDEFASLRPDDAVLSEEGKDSAERLSADRVWIVDPLDGTREFSERGADGVWRTDWAVHVALWERGKGLTAGAVSLPARDLVYSTADALPLAPRASDGPLRVAVSRTRPTQIVQELAGRQDVEFVAMGSAGVKAMAVVSGEVDVYLHEGGQYEWDSAAPVVVALHAGLVATRLDGSAFVYNRSNPWLPDVYISRPEFHPQLRVLVDELLQTRETPS